MITTYGATATRVKVNTETFDLALDAIAEAINNRTRAIIVNSPNNPTGKIYPPETLKGLAHLLTTASERIGRPIYLLSDEAYSRILFDDRTYPSPTVYYPNSLLFYTYGKTLLTPGQRLGFIALPPEMPAREALRDAIVSAQFVTGFAFPNALLQHALADLETPSIDISHLQKKRDLMIQELRRMGYELHVPEGTFYLLVTSPLPDDFAFMEVLAQHNIYCLPGTVIELPGMFRVSLTANDEMIERALPGFEAAIQTVRNDARKPNIANVVSRRTP
jgi:aspartate aminotransferase